MTALRTHYVNISQHTDNADGTLTVEAIARRSGTMRYRSDSGDRVEFVPPALIDARDDAGRPVMGMLAGAPNTNEHPAQVVRYNSDSRKAVQVGKVAEEIHIYTDADGERSVKVRFDVSDPETIADIRSGRKTGVSLGYLCNVIKEDGEYKGVRYTHRQAMPLTIDHLAIVANPRNPGALITRFDSDDIAVMAVEEARSSFEVIRVDACCAACDGEGKPGCSDDIEDDGPKTKKKKVKNDAEDLPMITVTFAERTHELSIPQAQALWADGTIDRVRMDGEDYFMAADVALVLANQGLIHEDAFVAKAGIAKGGGKCGRGWVGVKGSCKRGKAADQAGALNEFAQKKRAEKYGVTVNPSPQQKAKSKKVKIAKEPSRTGMKPIKSQSDFTREVTKAVSDYGRDYGTDLVPIHKIRKEIGERVSRQNFNDWLNEMHSTDKATLIGGEMPGLTPEIAADSVRTSLGAPRYYMKLNKVKNDAEDTPITIRKRVSKPEVDRTIETSRSRRSKSKTKN